MGARWHWTGKVGSCLHFRQERHLYLLPHIWNIAEIIQYNFGRLFKKHKIENILIFFFPFQSPRCDDGHSADDVRDGHEESRPPGCARPQGLHSKYDHWFVTQFSFSFLDAIKNSTFAKSYKKKEIEKILFYYLFWDYWTAYIHSI